MFQHLSAILTFVIASTMTNVKTPTNVKMFQHLSAVLALVNGLGTTNVEIADKCFNICWQFNSFHFNSSSFESYAQ